MTGSQGKDEARESVGRVGVTGMLVGEQCEGDGFGGSGGRERERWR